MNEFLACQKFRFLYFLNNKNCISDFPYDFVGQCHDVVEWRHARVIVIGQLAEPPIALVIDILRVLF